MRPGEFTAIAEAAQAYLQYRIDLNEAGINFSTWSEEGYLGSRLENLETVYKAHWE